MKIKTREKNLIIIILDDGEQLMLTTPESYGRTGVYVGLYNKKFDLLHIRNPKELRNWDCWWSRHYIQHFRLRHDGQSERVNVLAPFFMP